MPMKKIIHPAAGLVAGTTIAAFWVSTLVSELSGSLEAVVAVKTAIPWGFLLLIPALAAAGGSGFSLAAGRRGGAIAAKRKRMPIIAANGLLVLVPCALYLAAKAQAGEFDRVFYAIQAVELVAGAVNFTLVALNARDGRRMARARDARFA